MPNNSQRGISFPELGEHYPDVSLLNRKKSYQRMVYHVLFLQDIIICEQFDLFLRE